MEFFCTDIELTDRHMERNTHEEATLTIKLMGSGDTTVFKSGELLDIIMERLTEIKPK